MSTGGSSTGGNAAQNAISLQISSACGALAGTSCSVALCLSWMLDDQAKSEIYGCGAELEAFLTCSLAHPFECTSDGVAEWSQECDPSYQTLLSCLPNCNAIDSTNGCSLTCTGNIPWSADCTLDGQFAHCTCTQGPLQSVVADLAGGCGTGDWVSLLQMLCVTGEMHGP